MLSKREKILLQVLGAIFVLAILFTTLFTPAVTAYMTNVSNLKALEEELETVQLVYDAVGIEEAMAKEKAQAEENYQYFYGVLNSYTIDGIVNQMLQQKELRILNLDISAYEEADYDFPLLEEDIETGTTEEEQQEEETEKVLVKSIIRLNVEGEYPNILGFIDQLNDTSTCLRINYLNIAYPDGGIEAVNGMSAYIEIYVYGVNVGVMTEVSNTSQESGNHIEEQ